MASLSLSQFFCMFIVGGQGRNADALALYFGEDPARCPFEQGNIRGTQIPSGFIQKSRFI